MFLFMALAITLLVRSQIAYNKKSREEKKDNIFQLMMRTKDPEIVLELLEKHVSRTQSFVSRFALDQLNKILDGLSNEDHHALRRCLRDLDEEQSQLKKYRRKELLSLRRIPADIAMERNTWYHLGVNSDQQFIYCLKRMLEPIKEHVDNNFNPIPRVFVQEFLPVRHKIDELMKRTEAMLSSGRFVAYDSVLTEADALKDELSVVRKHHYDRMQNDHDNGNLQISLVYLNILQESQEFLSIMRHQLRAANRFYGNDR